MDKMKTIICTFLILLTTGCWDYRDMNQLAVVGAIGIDLKDDGYNVSVQIVNAKKAASNTGSGGGASEEAPITIYEAEGKTIREALGKITLESPKTLYLGHLYLIIIGDELGKKGIKDTIDFILRDNETRKIFPMAIAEGEKAINLLKTISPIETISSGNISESLKIVSSKNGVVSNRTFDEVLQCIYTEGREATMTSLKLIGDKKEGEKQDNISSSSPSATIKISGSAILDKYKVIGYMNEKESTGYTILRDKISKMVLTFPCDEDGSYGSSEVLTLSTSLNSKPKDDKVNISVETKGRAVLTEYNCKMDLTKTENIKKVEKMINDELKKILSKTIDKSQELGVDVYGFGEALYRNDNKTWQKYKKDWNKTFSKAKYKITPKVTIESIGSTITSAKDR